MAAIILLVLNINSTAPTDIQPTSTGLNSTESHQVQGAATHSTTDEQAVVDSTTPSLNTTPAPAQSHANTRNQNTGTAPASNPDINNANPAPVPMPPATPSQPESPKADYNLNETWYFATAGTAGLYNTCWPTALDANNEAQCADPNSIYSQTWFTGIGISKNAETAQNLAADQAHQKALAQHVDPRRGGGEDAIVLTEVLCSQHGLSCSRW